MKKRSHRLCYNCHLKPGRMGGRLCTTCQVFANRNGHPRPHRLITRGRETIRRAPNRHFTPPATVYVWFDADERLLFVSMSVAGVKVNSIELFCNEEFFGMANEVRLYHFETVDAAITRTEELIAAARPPFNVGVGEVVRPEEEDTEEEEEYYD